MTYYEWAQGKRALRHGDLVEYQQLHSQDDDSVTVKELTLPESSTVWYDGVRGRAPR